MLRQHLGLAAVVAALAIIAIWAGAPADTVLLVAFVLACPLMMLLMMGSMHGNDNNDTHQHGHDHQAARGEDAPPGARRSSNR